MLPHVSKFLECLQNDADCRRFKILSTVSRRRSTWKASEGVVRYTVRRYPITEQTGVQRREFGRFRRGKKGKGQSGCVDAWDDVDERQKCAGCRLTREWGREGSAGGFH
ncbi:hypothetical protein SLEP1_g6085 [Rubroshorea leprosula]|uniref:Uncharacterized protein n=1 Tax=Rubroshorea leprosula TaxID=152421 RepID=A0AAV5HU27_9ROSI|nr:hypothetical protein SLEP1_g6085 [Rubroshorea leprosula]